MSKVIDRTGQVFGRLTVVKQVGFDQYHNALWECSCECGGEKNVVSGSLRKGYTRSCGCLRRERMTGDNHMNYQGGKGNRGSIAYFNKALTGHRYTAKERGHAPVNMTAKELAERYKDHNHCCDLCGVPENELPSFLHIDHDHDTGSFRGWLCSSCNTGMGLLGDSVKRLLQAVEYLRGD